MVAVANADYRAIAIDFRGYGLSDQPAEPEMATMHDLVDDVVGFWIHWASKWYRSKS